MSSSNEKNAKTAYLGAEQELIDLTDRAIINASCSIISSSVECTSDSCKNNCPEVYCYDSQGGCNIDCYGNCDPYGETCESYEDGLWPCYYVSVCSPYSYKDGCS